MTQGDDARARENTWRTARSLSPTYCGDGVRKMKKMGGVETRTLFKSSGPFTLMKFARDSFATAFASSVFPQPGGPHRRTPQAATMPTALNNSGLRIGCTIAMCSSSRVACNAPMSAQLTSGTVANPSRFEDGCTCLSANVKSSKVMHSGSSCASVSGSGWARRKCTIELAGDSAARDIDANGGSLARGVDGCGCGVAGSVVGTTGGSTAIAISVSRSSVSESALGRTMVPSDSCWKMRFTAMMPAAPVSAARSAPT